MVVARIALSRGGDGFPDSVVTYSQTHVKGKDGSVPALESRHSPGTHFPPGSHQQRDPCG